MQKKTIFWFFLMIGIAILVSGAIILKPTQSLIGQSPEDIVSSFYEAYLEYDGNPLVDKMYQGNTNLSPDFIMFLDEFTADSYMYDPVLCAQDKPQTINIADVNKEIDSAFITVETNFDGHEFEVELIRIDNTWLIEQVTCK